MGVMATADEQTFAEWVLQKKELERYFDRLFLPDPSHQIQAIYYIAEIINEAKRAAEKYSKNEGAQIDYLTICGITTATLESFSNGKTSTEPGKRALNVLCDLQDALCSVAGDWTPYSGPTL